MLLLNKKNRSAINEVKFMVQSNSCKKKKESCATTEGIKSIYWLPWQQKICHRVWKILKCDHCQYWRYRLTDIRYSTDSNEYQCYIMFLTYFDIY